jgi:hypothetical protein
VGIVLVGVRPEKLRITAADHELDVVLAAKAQRAGATLIELPPPLSGSSP